MAQINVHDAKTHLSKLLERVEGGEEIVIARNGTPVARLAPLAAPDRSLLGAMRDEIWIADDAFSPEVDALIARDFDESDI